MNILIDSIRRDGEYTQLLGTVLKTYNASTPFPIVASGLCEGASDALHVSLLRDIGKEKGGCALLICPDEKEAIRRRDLLRRFGLKCDFFIARDLTFYNITASHEYEHERLNVLYGIINGELDAVITTPDAALGYTIPEKILRDFTIKLEYGKQLSLDGVIEALMAAGYTRTEMVDSAGQFAVRGGIIDIFPPSGRYIDMDGAEITGQMPLRIELFGDEIDRMAIFDTETQRITENLDTAEIMPARELLISKETREKLKKAVSMQIKNTGNERAIEELIGEVHAIDNGLELNFADKYISLIYPEKVCLLDYMRSFTRTLVLMHGTSAVFDRLGGFEWHQNETVKELLEAGTIAPRYTEYTKPISAFELFCDENVTVHIDSFASGMSGKKLSGLFGFRTKHTISYAENLELLKEDLRSYSQNSFRSIVMCENEAAAKNMKELLSDEPYSVYTAVDEGDFNADTLPRGAVLIVWKEHISGYELPVPRIAILSTNPEGRMGAKKVSSSLRSRTKKRNDAKKILSYADLTVGDYIVHETYGIGIYKGIENVTVNGASRDYITIQYAGSDKLFLPTEKLDMVSKYIGARADDGTVKLSKFGGGDWLKAKSRAKAAVKEMAKELIQLYAQRMRLAGYSFPEDDDYQRDFDATFEYEETPAQLNAIEDIKRDMTRPVPMDRLLCGDVGFGKTEVALRAAFKAVLGGKQVAILVPTTILALQHYQTALSRFRSFPVSVDLISRFRTPKQQALTLRKLKRGEVDIIIGTHRLVSKDIEFNNLGLLIIDEEQRFGVAQKEKLKQMAGNVDVLTLTATPIPRTLNMAMSGIRDISILDDAPGDRLPVQTYVLEHDELIIEEAIRRELRRGGQIFYLYNNIDNIKTVAARLSAQIPDARITVAHGRMDKEELEDIWSSMLAGEIDILISTTIIETGVDIPNANTLIVENAHKLGLSQLHQIRGRVGRSSRRAYAYFTYPRGRAISEISTKRLEAIREYAEFGAGFKIALRDMEIRGAGNLLGAEQHGHLDAIGYDLYIKLLNDAVLEEKGEKVEEKPDCTVNLICDAFLPERYVSSSSQRMELYKRIAMIDTTEDREDLIDELYDRFGDLPRPARNLVDIAYIRAKAIACGVLKIDQVGTEVHIYPVKFDWGIWSELSRLNGGKIKVIMSSSPYLNFRFTGSDKINESLEKLFEDYLRLEKEEKDGEE
ncbi:MAG: transcription-repair coupling factor [Ruminococcaceae bacterium]|nr:transcription-repair coupling factor [Oscillospiraceae bacterium]